MKIASFGLMCVGTLLLMQSHAFAANHDDDGGDDDSDNPPIETVDTNDVNTTTCTWWTDGKAYGYCATVTPGSKNKDILYYFHGVMGDQKGWLGKAGRIWQAWDARHIDAPVVISISFGRVWLNAKKNSSDFSGIFETITQQMMPEIERKWWPNAGVGRRLLAGESMGAFNAFQLLQEYPNRWARVALMCPDAAALGPFDGWTAIKEFSRDCGADIILASLEWWMDRMFLATKRPGNRPHLFCGLQTVFNPSSPPLYISGSHKDQFGFFNGDQELAESRRPTEYR